MPQGSRCIRPGGSCWKDPTPLPLWTVQHVVNNDTRSTGGRGGRTTQRGANQEEGWRYSAEGAQDSPGEAGRPTQRVGGGGHHPYAPHKGFVHAGGGAAPSTEEGADLQGFTPAMAHLSLREVYEVSPHHKDGMHLTGGVPDEAIRKVVGRS